MENGMERKCWCRIWKMPEWNGRYQERNGTRSSILPIPYQFHSRRGANRAKLMQGAALKRNGTSLS